MEYWIIFIVDGVIDNFTRFIIIKFKGKILVEVKEKIFR